MREHTRRRTALLLTLTLAVLTFPLSAAESPLRFEKKSLSDQYLSDGIDAADLDQDGHPDLIAGQWWWKGPDFSHRYEFTTPEKLVREKDQSGNKLTYVHDFNTDGLPDILVIGRVHMHPAYWYQNPGKSLAASQHWKRHYVFERIKGESPPFADLTGDGKPEIITHDGAQWGYVSPDESDPSKPWTFHPLKGTEGKYDQFYHGTGLADLNADGRTDLLLAKGWYEHPKNPADPWPFHPHPFGTKGGAQMFAHDIDGDRDQDVVTSLDAHGWGLAWFEQLRASIPAAPTDSLVTTPQPPAWKQHTLMNTRDEEKEFGVAFTQPHALALADLDADGLPDLITGKRYWAHGPTGDIEPSADPVLYWFQLTRPPNSAPRFTPHLIDNASGVGTQLKVFDVNQDGRPDILTTGRVGTFLFLNQVARP